jgi:SAM-dependent methyltransferase
MSLFKNPKQTAQQQGEGAQRRPFLAELGAAWKELRKAPTLFDVVRDGPYYAPFYIAEYRDALKRYAPVPDWPKEKKAKILSLGCGTGDEAHALLKHFGNRGERMGMAEYTGVDLDRDSITLAKNAWERDNCKFIRADGRSLWGVVEGKIDVLVFAHPYMEMEGVSAMILEGMSVHAKGGLLIATFYRENEMQEFLEIAAGGYRILHCEERKGATYPAGSMHSVHDYILVGISK